MTRVVKSIKAQLTRRSLTRKSGRNHWRKQILPESILQGFRGKMYDRCLTYKQDMNNYINDKHAETDVKTAGSAPMDLDAIVAKVGDDNYKEKIEDSTEEELLTSQNNKGKGKGQSKGVHGKSHGKGQHAAVGLEI